MSVSLAEEGYKFLQDNNQGRKRGVFPICDLSIYASSLFEPERAKWHWDSASDSSGQGSANQVDLCPVLSSLEIDH